MIDWRQILELANATSLDPHVIEKDYVLGWILAGIFAHDELAESWIFKGGTCLKKCFFETYRFSEDLDFTLRDELNLYRNAEARPEQQQFLAVLREKCAFKGIALPELADIEPHRGDLEAGWIGSIINFPRCCRLLPSGTNFRIRMASWQNGRTGSSDDAFSRH